MTAKLIPLHQWAKLTYGDAAPCMTTLRKWARGGKLNPPAEKHGRSYFVVPDACYSSTGKTKMGQGIQAVARAPRDPQESATSLVQRLIRDRGGNTRAKRGD